jgi:hypothetical protein
MLGQEAGSTAVTPARTAGAGLAGFAGGQVLMQERIGKAREVAKRAAARAADTCTCSAGASVTKSGYSPAISICWSASWPTTVWSFGQHMPQHGPERVLLGPAAAGGGLDRFRDSDAQAAGRIGVLGHLAADWP